MRSRRTRLSLAGVALSGLMFSGCSFGIGSNTSVSDVLALFGVSGVEGLDSLTVGDVVAGFQQFLGSINLSDEQVQNLEILQAQLTAGNIDSAEFSETVRNLIGDLRPSLAFGGFGFFGSPFGHGPGYRIAEALELTAEQQTQAIAIFQALHDDVRALRQNTHAQVRAQLTDAQLVLLEEGHFGHPGRGALHRGGGRGRGHGGGFGFNGGSGTFLSRLIERLDLTAEQVAAIEILRDDLRVAVSARHQQARDEFMAILTPDQLALLEDLEFFDDDENAADDRDDADELEDDDLNETDDDDTDDLEDGNTNDNQDR